MTSDGADTVGGRGWPDPAACAKLLPELEGVPAPPLRQHPALLGELEQRLSKANADVRAASMRIECLGLLAEPPSMQAYEVTDKGSINQRAVIERRAEDVKALFADPRPATTVRSAPCSK